jgi:hypothetical protein
MPFGMSRVTRCLQREGVKNPDVFAVGSQRADPKAVQRLLELFPPGRAQLSSSIADRIPESVFSECRIPVVFSAEPLCLDLGPGAIQFGD